MKMSRNETTSKNASVEKLIMQRRQTNREVLTTLNGGGIKSENGALLLNLDK
jgi:hypothetical protein